MQCLLRASPPVPHPYIRTLTYTYTYTRIRSCIYTTHTASYTTSATVAHQPHTTFRLLQPYLPSVCRRTSTTRSFASSSDNNTNNDSTVKSASDGQTSNAAGSRQRASSSHYGTFNRSRTVTGTARGSDDRAPLSQPLTPPEQEQAQQLTDVDTVFANARLVVDEYRRRADTDVDEHGKSPTSILEYIRKLQSENETSVDHSNNDFILNDDDMRNTGISDKRQLRGKTLHTERLIGRLKQEEALQERLSMLDEFGRPELLKREGMQKIDQYGRAYGFGKRKCSSARVHIKYNIDSQGEIIINQQRYIKYFQRFAHRAAVVRPLLSTDTLGQFDIMVDTWGGGHTGQSDAVKLAIAKALVSYEPLLRPVLKEQLLLVRDARVVERKKFGRYKARKGFTFVKR